MYENGFANECMYAVCNERNETASRVIRDVHGDPDAKYGTHDYGCHFVRRVEREGAVFARDYGRGDTCEIGMRAMGTRNAEIRLRICTDLRARSPVARSELAAA